MELEIFQSARQRKPTIEKFDAGDILEFDICDDLTPPQASEIQFGDGTICFVTPDFWADVEIVKND